MWTRGIKHNFQSGYLNVFENCTMKDIERNVEEQSLSSSISDFCIDSLATNAFVVKQKEKAVEMVKKLIKEIEGDDSFINDEETEVSDASFEEEKEFDSDT
ncbi:DNA-directed RNA polymerase subunit beta'' [Bienertia sinuspersici]